MASIHPQGPVSGLTRPFLFTKSFVFPVLPGPPAALPGMLLELLLLTDEQTVVCRKTEGP